MGQNSIQEIKPEDENNGASTASAKWYDSTQWDFYNAVNAVTPDRRKHTGTNRTAADAKKKHKAKRRAQRAARKASRK